MSSQHSEHSPTTSVGELQQPTPPFLSLYILNFSATSSAHIPSAVHAVAHASHRVLLRVQRRACDQVSHRDSPLTRRRTLHTRILLASDEFPTPAALPDGGIDCTQVCLVLVCGSCGWDRAQGQILGAGPSILGSPATVLGAGIRVRDPQNRPPAGTPWRPPKTPQKQNRP